MNDQIARFAVRPNGNGGDAIIGALYKDNAINEYIKPGMVYDIIAVDGVLVIKEAGKSILGIDDRDSQDALNWSQKIGDIITTGKHLHTR